MSETATDYETLARSVERDGDVNPAHTASTVQPLPEPMSPAAPPTRSPFLDPGGIQTRGPVVITADGTIKDAATGAALASPTPAAADESELDISLVAFALTGLGVTVLVAACLLTPFIISVKVALIGAVVVCAAERLWWEIRRLSREEMLHAAPIIVPGDPAGDEDRALYAVPRPGDRSRPR